MWVEWCRDKTTVDDLPEREKTRATASKEDNAITALFKRNPALRLRKAEAKLAERGLHTFCQKSTGNWSIKQRSNWAFKVGPS